MIRFGMAMTFGELNYHPDQNWQGLEIAYKIAYGDQVENILSWEWQDKYTLRSSLYPYFLSLPLHVLRFLKIDSNALVVNSMLMMNTMLIVLGDYFLYKMSRRFLGKKGASLTLLYLIFNVRIN